ncbi:ankyrin repeat and BTB/POZ domain-containing protein BTBD11 [Strongylocentrotus purpuratus]|uniref:BTB domain-containing protein n=1 Tax=Strongylocentrotus purpuratus TaxID=7668 RepID=A0A7M7P475_STRPU|nr:ankyrin repeat and BTB/POZ domain-containing protein BTBD11 [Strongylocentrotus purpuratus]
MSRSLEQSLMVTCVGSIAELGDLVDRAMHFHQSRPRVTGSPHKTHGITWSPDALRTLFHFMRCNQLEYQDDRPIVQLTPERPYVVLPPLMEWIRVATTHCEHRLSSVVDSDDIRQAARLLLPGIDTPVRSLRTDESLCSSRHLDASQSTARFQQDLGFRMLACGRTDLVPNAAALLGPDGIDAISEQGMTALMLACARGDEAMVQILLDNGAKPNLTVPSNSQMYPCIHPTIRHWTALSFAVARRHTPVAQLLLDAGANVEGAHGENYTHSPLQLASAAGYHELVCLLLDKGADPYLTTLHRNGITSKGHGNSFALAAAHGHRNILRKLLEQPRLIRSSDILSLEEILAEGSDGPKERKANKARKNKIALMLQEAMYHSCEHNYLDIAMELRSLGVPWTFHCWLETLRTAKYFHRLAIIQCLFRDFGSIPIEEDYEELIRDGLPLMFEIFRQSKNDLVSKQLAMVFPLLMGSDKITEIPLPDAMHGARIDPQYINNPEMSDVTFVVEGRRFYAHKIVLVTASKRFKAMLSDRMLDPQKPVLEISEFSYHIFQLVMQYLYNGSTENIHVKPADLHELLSAANHFVLSGLQLHCERLLSFDLAWDNATTIYRQARLYGAESLLEYCHWFFLLNMPELLAKNETFKKLIFPPKQHPYDLPSMLQDTLAKQIFNRFTKQTTV